MKQVSKLSLLLIILFLLQAFHVLGQSSAKTSDVQECVLYQRGIRIEFTPPDVILDCGLYFLLNVTLTKLRHISPSFFSVSVFYKRESALGTYISRIGSSSFLRFTTIPVGEPITIQIPCLTMHDMDQYLNCMVNCHYEEFNGSYDENTASLGIKLERGNWLLQILSFLWRKMDGVNTVKTWLLGNSRQVWERFSSGDDYLQYVTPLRMKKIFSLLTMVRNFLWDHNPLINWVPISSVSPFLCTDQVRIEWFKADNETDSNGRFNMTVNITNNLPVSVTVLVQVDVSDQAIMNSFIPSLPDTVYNVYSEVVVIGPYSSNNSTRHGVFPASNYQQTEYDLTLLCAPYINVGSSNLFGLFTFDIRWNLLFKNKMAAKTTYIISSDAEKDIRTMWYNLPLYNKTTFFPSKHQSIKYKGGTLMENMVSQVVEELKSNWQAIFLLVIIVLLPSVILVFFIRLSMDFVRDRMMKKKNRP